MNLYKRETAAGLLTVLVVVEPPAGPAEWLRVDRRVFIREFSAKSARSETLSSSSATLRYLAKLMAATSSC